MARVKRGVAAHKKHKKLLKEAEGRRASKHKAQFRALWIARINAASREAGVSYSRLMSAMRTAGVQLDRKVLADMAVRDPKVFRHYIDTVSKQKKSSKSS